MKLRGFTKPRNGSTLQAPLGEQGDVKEEGSVLLYATDD